MRYPKFLKNHGRIGFIAPSFGCVMPPYDVLFEAAKEKLSQLGHICVEGPNCHVDCGIGKSNSPELCGAEINTFFTKDRCDILISCGGGETMCEDLPFVDFQTISEAEAKWFMGYSDNTNLILTLPTLCDTAAIYGPCAASFGQKPWHPALQDAYDLLTGKKMTFTNYEKWEIEKNEDDSDLYASYNCTQPFEVKIFDESSMPSESSIQTVNIQGRLLGGCLDCLSVLCGTKFDRVKDFNEKYADDGILWFIEACDLNPMGVRRALWQLREAGWFEHAAGFLLGRPLHYHEEMMGINMQEAVLSILKDLQLPIIFDIDLGHLPPMMPIVAGAVGNITAENNHFEIRYAFK